MITLYKYLRESIFDDEEDVLDNSISNTINKKLKELDKLFAEKWGNSPLYSRIVNDTLLLLDTKYKGIDKLVYDKIKELKDITGFTNISTKGMIAFDIPVIDSSLGDEIICSRIQFSKYVNIVKDIQLTFDNETDYYGYILQSAGDISFQNVEFKYNIRDTRSDHGWYTDRFKSTFYFAGVPTFKNCYNFNGLEQIYIYKRDAFKDQDIIKKFNNFLDDKHIATCYDSKIKDKYHKRKGDLKTLLTTIKMQKKYIFHSSENGKLFKIKPNARLKDILDVEGFKDLNRICITEGVGVMRIVFHKGELNLNPTFTQQPHVVKLPNDDWYMVIKKNK